MRRGSLLVALVVVATLGVGTPTAAADQVEDFTCNPASLSADFSHREFLAREGVRLVGDYRIEGRSALGRWGPQAPELPAVGVPAEADCDAATWKQERILSAALRYLNIPGNPNALKYRHHHTPYWDPATSTSPEGGTERNGISATAWSAGRGLDCSNFVAWVYNFGLGIKFGGNVGKQYSGAAGPMGQRLSADGPFQLGDLLYLHPDEDPDRASHVAIFIDDGHVIDSRLKAENGGVKIRVRKGWYRTAVLGGWRPIASQ